MPQPHPLEGAVLEIALHGVEFCHGVAYRGTRGKDYAAASGELVHIAAFHKHI